MWTLPFITSFAHIFHDGEDVVILGHVPTKRPLADNLTGRTRYLSLGNQTHILSLVVCLFNIFFFLLFDELSCDGDGGSWINALLEGQDLVFLE